MKSGTIHKTIAKQLASSHTTYVILVIFGLITAKFFSIIHKLGYKTKSMKLRFLVTLASVALGIMAFGSYLMASTPFSEWQRKTMIERINNCNEPLLEDGYEGKMYVLTIFREPTPDERRVLCVYPKNNPKDVKKGFITFDAKESKNPNVHPNVLWIGKIGEHIYRVKYYDTIDFSGYRMTRSSNKAKVDFEEVVNSIYPP